MEKLKDLSPEQIDNIIKLAWADRVSFEAIQQRTGLVEKEVIKVMRRELKPGSFRKWRARASAAANSAAAHAVASGKHEEAAYKRARTNKHKRNAYNNAVKVTATKGPRWDTSQPSWDSARKRDVSHV